MIWNNGKEQIDYMNIKKNSQELNIQLSSITHIDENIDTIKLHNQIAFINNAIDHFRDTLNTYKNEIDDNAIKIENLKTYAEFLLTITGLFALIVGAISWKSIDEQRNTAQYELEEMKKQNDRARQEIESMREGIYRELPILAAIPDNFKKILSDLSFLVNTQIKLLNRSSDYDYNQLTCEQKSKIHYYENVISFSYFLHSKENTTELSAIYSKLGLYYSSKFASTQLGNEYQLSKIEDDKKADLYRSMIYLNRAIDLAPDSYNAFMAAGFCTHYSYDIDWASRSQSFYQSAIVYDQKYQRPFIALALLSLEPFKKPNESLAYLEKARNKKIYDSQSQEPPVDGYISYLESCSYCALYKYGIDTSDEILERAMIKLEAAANKLDVKFSKFIYYDKDDYFYLLFDSSKYQTRFNNCQQLFNKFIE